MAETTQSGAASGVAWLTPQRLIATLLGGLWVTTLWLQPLAGDAPRLVLLLIPDEAVRAWFDGPVSLRGLLDRAAVIGIATAVVAQAALGGWFLLRHCRWLAMLTRTERFALAAAFGLGMQANATLALGWIGGLRIAGSPILIAVATWAVCGAVGSLMRHRGAADPLPLSRRDQESEGVSDAGQPSLMWPKVIAGLFAAGIVLRSILPPIEYDVREYHLQAAKEWWQGGRISFVPHNIYANMPMAAESQAVLAMMWFETFGAGADAWWWGALAGKVVIAAYAVLTALLVGGAVRWLVGGRWAAVAAAWGIVFSLAFPAVVEVTSLGLIEPAVATYMAAGLLIVAIFHRLGEPAGNPPSEADRAALANASPFWLGLAGGYAIACKYPAALIVVPVLAAMMFWSSPLEAGGRNRNRLAAITRLRMWLAFGAALFLGGGLWLAKNAALAGNPIYPLLGQWLGGETLTAEKIHQWNRAHAVPGYSLDGLVQSIGDLLWQWRLQGWVVVPMIFWGGIVGWRRPEVRLLAASALFVLVAWWIATHRVERFLLPAAPLAFALAAIGAAELYRAIPSRWASGALTVLVAMNALYVSGPAVGDSRIAVDLRYLRRDDESASSISRLPPHVRWVNQHLDENDRLLVVGDAAVFDYEVPLAYSTTFDRSPLVEIIERPQAEWGRALREAGFTHVLVHWGEIERLRSTYGFDNRITRELVDTMARAGVIDKIPVPFNEEAVEIAVVL